MFDDPLSPSIQKIAIFPITVCKFDPEHEISGGELIFFSIFWNLLRKKPSF